MNEFVIKNKIKLNEKEKLLPFKQREKRIVAKVFHGFGLVVPMDGDVGYRKPSWNVSELRRIFKRMYDQKTKNKKVNDREFEFIMGNIFLADDEGDPGMGYELGIDLFYSYKMFEKHAKRLLLNAYDLTERRNFKIILNAHLEVRGREDWNYNQLMVDLEDNDNENNDNKDDNRNK